jgi:predicted kinase
VAIVLQGFPGTGKSTLANALAKERPACVIIDKDVCKHWLIAHRDRMFRVSALGGEVNPPPDVARYVGHNVVAQTLSGDGDCADTGTSMCDRIAIERDMIAKLSKMSMMPTLPMPATLSPLENDESVIGLRTSMLIMSDDEINTMSYEVMVRAAEVFLEHRIAVIIDSPFMREPVFLQLKEACDRVGVRLAVIECYVQDEAIWDDRLKKRKKCERAVQQGFCSRVRKPGSVSEIRTMYASPKRVQESKALRECLSWYQQKREIAFVEIETGYADLQGQVQAALQLPM